jgi:hypothetical protein
MRRTFAIDVLVGPRCAGRLRLVGAGEDPAAAREFLAALLPPEPVGPDPPAGALAMVNGSPRLDALGEAALPGLRVGPAAALAASLPGGNLWL